MRYVLYNPFSGKGEQAKADAECYNALENIPTKTVSIAEIKDLRAFLSQLNASDDIAVFGGDGTLNVVVNALPAGWENNVYYYPCGTGNDFARDIDIAYTKEPIQINGYIQNLPTVTVNGEQRKFINGVGFGIDGYCCEVGDQLKSQGKLPDYTGIAIKGLLFHFKPVNATVVVDGEKYEFKKVWIAPTMFGRYYGGGMMPTPEQDRNAAEKKVSLMVFHGSGKMQTLMIFPSIFKGEHVKHKENITILKGKNITVTFDRATSLQIDGETRLNVSSYTVSI